MLRRLLILGILCAHWSAAALPCAPILAGPDPHARASALSHHHHAGHHGEAAPCLPAWTAPCPCGCEADPAGAAPTARVGAALLREADALALPPVSDPGAAPQPGAHPEPDPRRDRVPI